MGRKVTTDIFIREAKERHGDRYDYSKSVYKTSKDKLEIICKLHGSFYQSAYVHLKGRNCPECSKVQRGETRRSQYTTFIEDSEKVHKGIYDYSETVYSGKLIKVKIRCREHGVFEKLPSCHLLGKGYSLCRGKKIASSKTKTTEWFVEKAKDIHGNKYSYDDTKYHRSTEKVIITCKVHGSFKLQPFKHLKGLGCPECRNVFTSDDQSYLNSTFIKKATKVHGDLFDYKDVVYKNSVTPVDIFCKSCELVFKQKPANHLSGHGCTTCYRRNISERNRLSTEDFVLKARKVHGEDAYDYTDVLYKLSSVKVNIKCNSCFETFSQVPNSHLRGSGCPVCYSTRGYSRSEYREVCKKYDYNSNLYLVRCYNDHENFLKVGITVHEDVSERFKSRVPYDIEVLHVLKGYCDNVYDAENKLKRAFRKDRYSPKLSFKGETECFNLNVKDKIFETILAIEKELT